MKTIDIINAFVNGETKGRNQNLRIEGDKLFNYETCLAERYEKLGGQEFGIGISVNTAVTSPSGIATSNLF